MNMREKIVKEKISFDAIAKTLEKPLGTIATEANITHAMKIVGMWKDYNEAVLGRAVASGIALAHARTSALAAAVKKLAGEMGVDISSELGTYFSR